MVLVIAAALFVFAAIAGLTMAYIGFKKKRNPPFPLVLLHGAVAMTALVILLWGVLRSDRGGPVAWALGLFFVAALGGFFLFSYHIRGRHLPSPVIAIHGTQAITALVMLLAGIIAG